MLIEAHLTKAKEPLQIPYPRNFSGEKSGSPDDKEFHLSCQPRYLTEDEVAIAEAFVTRLLYPQTVSRTGAVQIGDDPLLEKDQEYLDEVEKNAQLENTRQSPSGGDRSVFERVLIIRERGYRGNGYKMLQA